MASTFLTIDWTSQIILGNYQFAYVGQGVLLTTTSSAIESLFDGAHWAANNIVRVYGAVASEQSSAINLWGTSSSGGGHSVEIGATGTVDSFDASAAIHLFRPEYFQNSGRVTGYHGVWVEEVSGRSLHNDGTISAAGCGIRIEKGTQVSVLNDGMIVGNIGIEVLSSDAQIINTGIIEGRSGETAAFGAYAIAATLTNSPLSLINSGTIISSKYAYLGSPVDDLIINTGSIFGKIDLSQGNDNFDSREGIVSDLVSGVAGNDTLLGGRDANVLNGGTGEDYIEGNGGADRLNGFLDADTIDGGDGEDWIIGGAGADLLIGGAGNDMLDYAGAAVAVTVDLETGHAAGGDAEGDQFSGFEWLRGGSAGDVLTGDGAGNRMLGGGGNDSLRGGSGNDRMLGDAGNDTLAGDGGADILNGGLGADRFRYLAIGDSTTLVSGRDAIYGFSKAEGDRIDLATIDANGAGAGNTAFSFIAGSFTGVAGQLRTFQSGGNTFVEGDTDGVNGANFQIKVMGLVAFAASDFFL